MSRYGIFRTRRIHRKQRRHNTCLLLDSTAPHSGTAYDGSNATSLPILRKIDEGWAGKLFRLRLNFRDGEIQFIALSLKSLAQIWVTFCLSTILALYNNIISNAIT